MSANRSIEKDIWEIVATYKGESRSLIPIMQDIQEKHRFISPEAIKILSEQLGISENKIYGVATFYSQFRFTKPGKHMIRVCMGTACHVRGGEGIIGAVERGLDIGPGETTDNSRFSLERVACLGCCALSPVMAVDTDIYGKLTPTKVDDILKKYAVGERDEH